MTEQATFETVESVQPLQPPDLRHYNAAVGWMELGNHLEATEELEQIEPRLRVHPDVLRLRWQIYAKSMKWDMAVASAGRWCVRSSLCG